MEAHLSSHHRDTIEKIFSHPPSRNIEWRQVVSLLGKLAMSSEARAMPVASAIWAIDVESNPCCANGVNATSIGA